MPSSRAGRRPAHAFVILAADEEELKQAGEVETRWPDVRFSIGVHPHAAGNFERSTRGRPQGGCEIEARLLTRGLGEIGLTITTIFPRTSSGGIPRADQARTAPAASYRSIPARRRRTRFVSSRRAAGECGGVFHSFTETVMARRALTPVFISLAGIDVPARAELHEGEDGPSIVCSGRPTACLAPVLHRGRAMSRRARAVVEVVAELRGITAEVAWRPRKLPGCSTRNCYSCHGLARRTR
jgi:Tat protein secretion system quality control protein TatD with DNase activity